MTGALLESGLLQRPGQYPGRWLSSEGPKATGTLLTVSDQPGSQARGEASGDRV